jgi:hypothetical protein
VRAVLSWVEKPHGPNCTRFLLRRDSCTARCQAPAAADSFAAHLNPRIQLPRDLQINSGESLHWLWNWLHKSGFEMARLHSLVNNSIEEAL